MTSEHERVRVVRDSAWVEREYDRDKWARILAEARRLVEGGETSLPRVVAQCNAFQRGEPDLPFAQTRIAGKLVELPLALAFDGLYAMVAQRLRHLAGAEADAVMELGCGWGRSLFELWLAGGPRRARYVGMEFTRSGCDCAALLAGLQPDLEFQAQRYDLHAPRYPDLGRRRRLLVYSLHAIEQIPHVREEVIADLLPLADEVVGFHLEPIGWQLLPQDDEASKHGRENAERNDYNRNFASLLRRLHDEGKIRIERELIDFVGINPDNVATVVEWRKLR